MRLLLESTYKQTMKEIFVYFFLVKFQTCQHLNLQILCLFFSFPRYISKHLAFIMALFNMIIHRWITMRKHGGKAEVLLSQSRSRNKVIKEYIHNHYLGVCSFPRWAFVQKITLSISPLVCYCIFVMIYYCLVHWYSSVFIEPVHNPSCIFTLWNLQK